VLPEQWGETASVEAFPNPPCTTLDATPVSRERPFLFVDGRGRYNVYVPTAQQNSRGVTWANGMTPGHAIPITDFFVVKPSDSVQVINNQLARGRNLLLTPGVYDVAKSIAVKGMVLSLWFPGGVRGRCRPCHSSGT